MRQLTLWQFLRRPSTVVLIGAGLLAADPLRWLIGTWTDATSCEAPLALRFATLLVTAIPVVAWARATRAPADYGAVVLPVTAPRPLCDRELRPSRARR